MEKHAVKKGKEAKKAKDEAKKSVTKRKRTRELKEDAKKRRN